MSFELAEALKFSTWVRNCFGMCPYYIDPKAKVSAKIVQMTRRSVYLPILIQIVVFSLFAFGVYGLFKEYQRTGELASFNEETFKPLGIPMAIGSLTLVVLQLNFCTSFIIYIATLLITFKNRHQMTRITSKLFETYDLLCRKYGANWSPRILGWVVNSVVFAIISYHLFVAISFSIFLNRGDLFVSLPVSFLFQLISSSISTLDNALVMFLLDRIFIMIHTVSPDKVDSRFLQLFYESLDLLEDISQSYGLREFFNVTSEFIEMLSQSFFMFYVVINNPGSSWAMVFFGTINWIPRAFKLLLVTHFGAKISQSVCWRDVLVIQKALAT